MSNKKNEEKHTVQGDGAFIEKLKIAFKEVTDLPDEKCINLIEGLRCKNPEDIPLDMERFHKFCSDTITQMTIVEGVSRGYMFVSYSEEGEMEVSLRSEPSMTTPSDQ